MLGLGFCGFWIYGFMCLGFSSKSRKIEFNLGLEQVARGPPPPPPRVEGDLIWRTDVGRKASLSNFGRDLWPQADFHSFAATQRGNRLGRGTQGAENRKQ